ncbi:Rho termination factor N-terminal domain-containing protein, partial [Flavobacteriales bacterium]|nr:Rho termination factor N-terminal domain-containing protein [Flavobacteriales bacterium]
MFDIIELNGKKVAELRQIAGKLGITRLDKLKKQDLVYSILDAQAAQPADKSDKKSAPKGRAKSAKPNDDGAESPKEDQTT